MNTVIEADDTTMGARGGIIGLTACRRVRVPAIVVAVALPLTFGLAGADVPAPGHVATCHQEAREALRGRTAFPTQKDEAGASDARSAQPAPAGPPNATAQIVWSPDPQLSGMNVEGAKDAVYRAAYRVCMRKSGF
jgi:hypothetical protein